MLHDAEAVYQDGYKQCMIKIQQTVVQACMLTHANFCTGAEALNTTCMAA